MLAYSGRGQFQVRDVELNTLIRENLDLFSTALPKHVAFRTQLHDPLPPIDGDPGQLQQVIMNLLINAAEAIGERAGTVDVTTAVETIPAGDAHWLQPTGEFLPPGTYIRLSVRDDGCGMDEATCARIFDPFFSTKITGRGLGLSAVLGIVRGHRGGLHVDSAPGQGTTFTVLFPAQDYVAAPAPVAEARPVLPAEGVVLIIDDEEAVRRAVADILELHGLPTLTADDGTAGLAMYRERQADIRLVLLDLSMPGLGGEETFRALRAVNPDVRVVLSSGYQEGEASRHFAAGDLIGFLQKPYDAATLLAPCPGPSKSNPGPLPLIAV
jgi:CheY-like chemotaxis protein